MDYSKLITVNYGGGSGGEFIANLINSAIKGSNHNVVGDVNNRYIFNRPITPLEDAPNIRCPLNPQLIFEIHKNKHLQECLKKMSLLQNPSGREYILSSNYIFYEYIKAPTNNQLKENIKQTIRRMVDIPIKYTIITFHNLRYNTSGLGLQDIFPLSKNLMLGNANPTNLYLFNFLGWFKNSSDRYGTVDAQTLQQVLKIDSTFKSDYKFHTENIIFMDKLIFADNCLEYETQLNQQLTDILGVDIVLDSQALADYRIKNQQIIRDQFNIPSGTNLLDRNVTDQIASYMEDKYGKLI